MIGKKEVAGSGSLDFADLFIQHLQKEHGYSEKQVKEILSRKKEDYLLPATIFSLKELSAFESVVKYLRENQGLSFKRVCELTGRSYTAVYTTYSKANKKYSGTIDAINTEIVIPLSILKERKLSVLESIVKHLKERYDLTLHKIGEILGRDDRTIWTVYDRAKKKIGGKK